MEQASNGPQTETADTLCPCGCGCAAATAAKESEAPSREFCECECECGCHASLLATASTRCARPDVVWHILGEEFAQLRKM